MPAEEIETQPHHPTGGRLGHSLRWLAPGIGLVLVPKCPACLAAYLALFTGVGVSLPVAETLRIGLLVVCVASLAWLVLSKIRRSDL